MEDEIIEFIEDEDISAWKIEFSEGTDSSELKCTIDMTLLRQLLRDRLRTLVLTKFMGSALGPEPYQNDDIYVEFMRRAAQELILNLPERLNTLLEESVSVLVAREFTRVRVIPTGARKPIAEAYLETFVQDNKRRTRVKDPGRPRKRDRDKLERMIVKQLRAAPPYLNPTLSWVARKLNLKSSDALRKELKRHNLDWKELKKRT